MQLPHSVLFDWDNTLVDSLDCIRSAMSVMCEQMNLDCQLDSQTTAQAFYSLRDSFPAIFHDRWQEARDIFYNYYRAHHLSQLRPKPGAETLLTKVASHGLYMAVVSNKEGELLRCEVDALGWGKFFTRVIGASDASFDKPDPAPVIMALEPVASELAEIGLSVVESSRALSATLGLVNLEADRPAKLPRSQVWFIGDSLVDLECAHRSGCVSILIAPHLSGQLEPDYHFTDCHALAVAVPEPAG